MFCSENEAERLAPVRSGTDNISTRWNRQGKLLIIRICIATASLFINFHRKKKLLLSVALVLMALTGHT